MTEQDNLHIAILPHQEWLNALPLLQELRESLTEEQLSSFAEKSSHFSYELSVVRSTQGEDGKILAVAGYALSPHLERQQELWIHDFVVRSDLRGKGIGQRLLGFVESRARQLNCKTVRLHSGKSLDKAHTFYSEKGGYGQDSLVFSKFV